MTKLEKNIIIASWMGREYQKPKDGDIELWDYRNNDIDYSHWWDDFMSAWIKFRDMTFKGDCQKELIHSKCRSKIAEAIVGCRTPAEAFNLLAEGIEKLKNK